MISKNNNSSCRGALVSSLWLLLIRFSIMCTLTLTTTTMAFTPSLFLWKHHHFPKNCHDDYCEYQKNAHSHSHFMHSGSVDEDTTQQAAALSLELLQDNTVVEATTTSPSRTVLFGSSATGSSSSSSTSSSTVVLFNTGGSSYCDDVNRPPSLNILLKSIQDLCCPGAASATNTDIRGRFVNHKRLGSMASVAQAIGKQIKKGDGKIPSLTPIAAYCLGHGLAHNLHLWKKQQQQQQQASGSSSSDDNGSTTIINILIGRDPRPHGTRLADAVARGAESYRNNNAQVKVYYTGIATTPGCAALCLKSSSSSDSDSDDDDTRLSLIVNGNDIDKNNNIALDASVMITASHLPEDRNGLKFFAKHVGGGFEHEHIQQLAASAMDCAVDWYNRGTLPPSSGKGAVMCTSHVNWMPLYAATLKRAMQRQIIGNGGSSLDNKDNDKPLKGLRIVLNAGHGSGGFFQQVLNDLGANTTGSIGCTPIINDDIDEEEDDDDDDETTTTTTSSSGSGSSSSSSTTFPNGVPNPEYPAMYKATVKACRDVHADLGIMLDTDADRCAFVVPSRKSNNQQNDDDDDDYEPLNRNRLIALLGVVFATEYPASTVVTCSVTSEGLSTFLQDHLGLKHVRYLKGYANVIRKAKEITYSSSSDNDDVAELAIETSGHCAMRENNYIDDGTYTAVKVVSLLAQQRQQQQQGGGDSSSSKSKSLLLDLISEMKELSVLDELRFPTLDASLNTMRDVFDFCALAIEQAAMMNKNVSDTANTWELDTENLEGIRVRFGNNRSDGQFFMLRKSLHDPIISLQIEGTSRQSVHENIIQPLWQLFNQDEQIKSNLDLSVLQKYE